MNLNVKYHRTILWILLLAATFLPRLTFAQQAPTTWVPFTAQKVTKMYALSTSGRGDIISETRKFIARNKDGSQFEYDAVNYDPSSREHHFGTLQDAATGKMFRIDYEHQRVKVLRTLGPDAVLPLRPPNPKEVKPVSPELSLGSKVISGIQCFGTKVVASGPNYPGGESWAAPSLNYELVEGTILNYADHVRIEVHLEDVQVGREADPELFRIPEGYQMQ